MINGDELTARLAALETELQQAYEELDRTNSELLQLTVELDDRVARRTEELSRANELLAAEITTRKQAEAELQQHRDQLELTVQMRTRRLAEVNQELEANFLELQASEERFKSLVLTVPDIIYRLDKDGYFIFLNDAIRRLGYEPDELMGEHFSSIIVPVKVAEISRDIVLEKYRGKNTGPEASPKLFDERRTGARRTRGLEVKLLIKNSDQTEPGLIHPLDDAAIQAEVNASGVFHSQGSEERIFIGTVGVIRDISDRKQMEENLRLANESLELKVQERTGALIQANQRLLHEMEERKKIEEHLRHQQKMESLGTMAGGVAHEINNPVNIIMNYAELILDEAEAKGNITTFCEGIVEAGNRIADIVRNLLTFARQEGEERRAVSIRVIISSAMHLMGKTLERDDIEIELQVPENLPEVVCRQSQIQQVIIALISNSREALNLRFPGTDDNKRIIIKAEAIIVDGEQWLRLSFVDFGHGIPLENQARIFDPFFSTKPRNQGRGLGLSTCHGIISEHGGRLTLCSNESEYTRFDVDLPVKPDFAGVQKMRQT